MADTNTKTKAKEDTREPFAAFVRDDATAAILIPIVEDYGWQKKRVQKGTLENATRALGIMEPPKLLVVDLEKSKNPADDMSALLEACGDQTFVIALGETNDVQLYRDLIAAGVNDYILKPVTHDVMASAISKGFLAANAIDVDGGPKTPNSMCTVIGVRGGIGASLLATTVSWIIANEYKRQTALLDLDIHFGTSALSFDIEPGRGLADALEDPTRVDELFIERAMVKVNDNLTILGSEMPFEETFEADPAALNNLVIVLKKKSSYLMVDLPRGLAGQHSHVLEESNDILLVTELALAATRDTIRFLGFLKNVAPKANIHVVVNYGHGVGIEEVSLKDFETSIEAKINWILPSDPKVILNAVKKGKVLPEISKDSKLVRTMRQIAQDLTGLKKRPKQKGKWSLKK